MENGKYTLFWEVESSIWIGNSNRGVMNGFLKDYIRDFDNVTLISRAIFVHM